MIRMSKNDPKNAERAAEHFAVKVLGCVKTVRAVQTQFQRQDMFGSDVIGKNKYGVSHYVQVTTGGKSAVQQRKRKMLDYPWHNSDRVYVVQMEKFREKNRVKYAFVVNELWPNQILERAWMTWKDKTAIDKSWFKALKNSK